MACNCNRRHGAQYEYVWTDGTSEVVYDSVVAARAKVIRKGGSYTKQEKH